MWRQRDWVIRVKALLGEWVMGLAAPTGERLGYEGKGTGGNFGVIKVISLMGH